ncbi:MAG: tRNA pseudouridine(55) synthase TruB [Paracoccus sp. (in: a-proteobacteria)]|uniref:tRNA pseudouridine(55) synthase TruB n=1 Tax=Paracoccus sp. TaxID=267 RepID=UPI0026DFFEF6|nr:tRNA pseudouridine(55) synthase TruB [Paracoccus sp. (in: a-proteobacteria)]MDO5621712.1 tRNA pseudouridine(55) synthase TruB [Paracoccus sp. (in: a-proteobacteria)]
MARKKGRDISGWLVVDKPAGIGSTDVVGRVRWALDAKKAGHAGTLDPDATGLLAVALGEATKTVPLITDALKCYDFTVNWGAETNSDDASGQVLRTSDARPDAAAIEAALAAYRGDIMQVPPAVSAVKVDGARAYDLAREGEAVELAARPLYVDELTLVAAREGSVDLRMVCGKGGYVRSVARDLGRDLGCLGHVQTLRRIWSGPFDLTDAIGFDQIDRSTQAAVEAALLPLQAALTDLPEMRATPEGAARIRNGNPGQVIGSAEFGETVWVSHQGQAICVGRYMGAEVHPSRVFNL